MTPEKTFENKIKRWLESKHISGAANNDPERIGWYFKVHGSAFQAVGIPDLIGCIHGQMFAIEVKAEGGRLSSLQKITLSVLKKSGATVMAVWPKDFDKMTQTLELLIEQRKVFRAHDDRTISL